MNKTEFSVFNCRYFGISTSMPHQYWYWLLNIGYQFSSCGISIREWRITFYSVGIHLITVEVCHSEESAIPKAVIQGLRGIVLDIVSYYLAIGRFKGCKGAIL